MVILLLIFGRSQAEETNTETKLVLTKDARIVIAPQKQNPINFTSWATEPLPQPIPEPLKNPTEVVIYSLDDLIAKYFPLRRLRTPKRLCSVRVGEVPTQFPELRTTDSFKLIKCIEAE